MLHYRGATDRPSKHPNVAAVNCVSVSPGRAGWQGTTDWPRKPVEKCCPSTACPAASPHGDHEQRIAQHSPTHFALSDPAGPPDTGCAARKQVQVMSRPRHHHWPRPTPTEHDLKVTPIDISSHLNHLTSPASTSLSLSHTHTHTLSLSLSLSLSVSENARSDVVQGICPPFAPPSPRLASADASRGCSRSRLRRALTRPAANPPPALLALLPRLAWTCAGHATPPGRQPSPAPHLSLPYVSKLGRRLTLWPVVSGQCQ
ncbi:hypothetical protein EV126DRAFT_2922 [Verticillium dahliae]|nr:hypothetical protein EV126DRAFT_2922 [Verticillium dahliae]